MRIRLRDLALVDDLCAHFARSGFAVRRVGEGGIVVGQPDRASNSQERRDAVMHLRIWRAVNPGVATIVD